MATLWEQSDSAGLELDHVDLPDTPTKLQPSELVFFGDPEVRTARNYAILDGRQRSTAIAMAFGGLRPSFGGRKYAGSFFLNLHDDSEVRPVIFKKNSEVERAALGDLSVALSKALLPLAPPEGEGIFGYWLRAAAEVAKAETYAGLPDDERPSSTEIAERRLWIERCFQALNRTKLAVYIVPPEYGLSDICEIFETLNTTGTRVSTVDLVHSWLYAETRSWEEPILLRESIDELGSQSGAEGWASKEDRPELIAQIVTACHVAAEKKHPPREVGGKATPIASVKAADLLGTPTLHWSEALSSGTPLAMWIKDFQRVVIDGRFSHRRCPYPVSAGIYVALRWHHYFDTPESHPWTIADLDGVFRAFFWRNALGTRYDQGFLTQLGTDIRRLKALLAERGNYPDDGSWVEFADSFLADLLAVPLPSESELENLLLSGGVRGALQRALTLPLLAGVEHDPLEPSKDISFPGGADRDLHHIVPRAWVRDNAPPDQLTDLVDSSFGRGIVNSAANLMPLSSASNRKWRAKRPGVALIEAGVDYSERTQLFASAFIDERCYELLTGDYSGNLRELHEFWTHRATLIAKRLTGLQRVGVH